MGTHVVEAEEWLRALWIPFTDLQSSIQESCLEAGTGQRPLEWDREKKKKAWGEKREAFSLRPGPL